MTIYFDHAAAAGVLPEIRRDYPLWLEKYSGNIEAAHQQGRTLRNEYKLLSAELVENLFPGRRLPEFAVFTAADTAILLECVGRICGSAHCAWGSALNHASTTAMLKRHWQKIYDFPLNEYGKLRAMPACSEAPAMIFITHVQSEIGVRQDVDQLLPLLRGNQLSSKALILLDSVQAISCTEYEPSWPLPDLMLISGAKLGAGSGAALIALGSCCKLMQKGFELLRKKEYLIGKNDLIQLQAMTCAAQYHRQYRQENRRQLQKLNSYLRAQLENMPLPNGQYLQLTVPASEAAENILHMLLPGYQSGILVRMFSQHNILLSAGTACEAESNTPSKILSAINLNRMTAYSGLRLSLSTQNTISQAQKFLQLLPNLLKDY